jgi:replicative DNA helicase
VLTLDPDAAALLLAFEAEIEPRLAADRGDLGHVAGWGSKLVGATCRLAGLLHLAERLRTGWSAPVTVGTVDAAIALGRYLTEHALAAFGLMGSGQVLDDAQYVLGWVDRTATERVTRRDLFTALPRGRFPKVDDLDPALEVLEHHGYLRRVEQPRPKGAGRPPSPTYDVNPRWEH